MEQAKLKSLTFILAITLVGVLADGLLIWQASSFNPEISVVSINLRHKQVLGEEDEQSVEPAEATILDDRPELPKASLPLEPVSTKPVNSTAPIVDPQIKIALCESEATSTKQKYLNENSKEIITQRFCDQIAPDYPCQPTADIIAFYSDPTSGFYIPDPTTRQQIIDQAIATQTKSLMTQVQKAYDIYLTNAEELYNTTYVNCLSQ